MQVLLKNISTVGELAKALNRLPPETAISPFGSESCKLVYSPEEQRAYIDEDFSWSDEEID